MEEEDEEVAIAADDVQLQHQFIRFDRSISTRRRGGNLTD